MAYRAGGDPGGEGSRMGTSGSVVGNGDRHVEMPSGSWLQGRSPTDRGACWVQPWEPRLWARPTAPPCPTSSRRLLVPDLTCLALLIKKGSKVVTGGSWPPVQQHGGPSAGGAGGRRARQRAQGRGGGHLGSASSPPSLPGRTRPEGWHEPMLCLPRCLCPCTPWAELSPGARHRKEE